MSLSRRQAEAVNQIIQEEVQDAIKGRHLADEHRRRAVLVEYGPGQTEDRVDASVLDREVETTISDQLFDAFDEQIFQMKEKVHRKMVQALFKATQKYGMGWTSPAEVGSLLAGGENDDVTDAEMEFFSDVQAAITNYGKNLAKTLIKTARPEGSDVDEGDY